MPLESNAPTKLVDDEGPERVAGTFFSTAFRLLPELKRLKR